MKTPYLSIVAHSRKIVKGCGSWLGGAVLGGFVYGPIFDIDEAIGRIDEAVIFGKGADVLVEIIDETRLVNSDGGDVVDPASEEGFVFLDAGGLIHGGTGAEDEIVDESVGVV